MSRASAYSLDKAREREEKQARAAALSEHHQTAINGLVEVVAMQKDEITDLKETIDALKEQIALICEALPIGKALVILNGEKPCNSQ